MAAQSDFDALVSSGGYVANQWPQIVAILKSMRAFWKAKVSQGAEPNDNLQYIYFGKTAMYNLFRLGTDNATLFTLHRNTGSEGAPVFVEVARFDQASGAVTLAATLAMAGALTGVTTMTLGGTLNMSGNGITNVGSIAGVTTISGVDITAHEARHLPGGADALTNNVAPPAIGSASAAGAGGALSNSGHTHEGLHQIDTDASGATQVKGDANFVSGAYMLVTKAGQNITFAFQKPGRVAGKTAADQTFTAEVDAVSLTALALAPATVVNTRTYEISGAVEFINGATATSTLTLRFYNGPAGALSDGVGKKILEHTRDQSVASEKEVVSFGPFPWTPAAAGDLKIGMSAQLSAGTGTLKGTGLRFCYLKCIEVFA